MAEVSSNENKAAWLVEEKGEIQVGPAPIILPEKGEVLIRAQAASIQPMDTYLKYNAILKLKYPTVLSSTCAGFVEALGDGVTKVKIGDRVASGTNIIVSGGVAKYGCLQRFVIAEEREVIEIGDLDFAEAVAWCSQTALAAVFSKSGLGIDLPTNPTNPTPSGKKILIWGGASAMGALATCYAKQAGLEVIATCSPHNFPLLEARGADQVFDYHDASTVEKIRALFPIDYFYNSASTPAAAQSIIDVLSPPGENVSKATILMLLPPSWPGMPSFPEGIAGKLLAFRNNAEENQVLVEQMMEKGGYLERGLKEGWIKGVPPERIGGLEAVIKGFEMVRSGMSGKKVVVEQWK